MREFDQQTTGQHEAALMAGLVAISEKGGDLKDLPAQIPSFPLKIQIQTHTRCNASCGMCPYPEITSEKDFSHKQMSEQLYQDILNQMRGYPVERLSLFLMNEPLLDRRMPQWLAKAKQVLPDTTLNLFSNGSALSLKLARRLCEAGLDELCVSVHGFDPHTYEEVMGLNFDRMRRNLDAVLEAKASGALPGLRIRLVTGDLPELNRSLQSAPDHMRNLILSKGFSNERRVSEVPAGMASSAPKTPEYRPCQRPFVKLYILADGACVLCNADWRQKEVLGHIGPGKTIADIWTGAAYQALRRRQISGDFPEGHPCKQCDYPKVAPAQ